MKKASNKQKAFTLAEVLITLAIIGIVATLTISSLVINYQKKQYVTQLKKSYTTLTNGFKTAMARDSVMKLSDTKIWETVADFTVNDEEQFLKEFTNSFKVLKYYKPTETPENELIPYKNLNGTAYGSDTEDEFVFFLADGSIIYFYPYRDKANTAKSTKIKEQGGRLYETCGDISIDVNGAQGPNQFGRDYFLFMLGADGGLYPYGGIDASLNLKGTKAYMWNNGSLYLCLNTSQKGWGCAARIMEENWQMNY